MDTIFLFPARVLGRKLASLTREQMNLNADLSNQMTERFNVSGALLVNDPALAKSLEGSVQNLEAVTAKIRAGEGSIGKLLNDDSLSRSLTSMTANLDGVTAKINKGEGTLGKMMTDDALYKRLDSVTARLDTVLQNLNDGQGTAGQLLHDKQLYENMNQTIADMRGLIAEIKKDPKKYLNVKVSIF